MKPGLRGRRSFALLHVLATVALLAAASLAWHAAFAAFQRDVVRGPSRAQARSIAQAAWVRSRAALEARREGGFTDEVCRAGSFADEPFLGGRASVQVASAGAGLTRVTQVTVKARVERARGEWIACELRLWIRPERAAVRVVSREEVSR